VYLQIKKNYEEVRRYQIFTWIPLDFVMDIIVNTCTCIDRPFSKHGFLTLVDGEIGKVVSDMFMTPLSLSFKVLVLSQIYDLQHQK